MKPKELRKDDDDEVAVKDAWRKMIVLAGDHLELRDEMFMVMLAEAKMEKKWEWGSVKSSSVDDRAGDCQELKGWSSVWMKKKARGNEEEEMAQNEILYAP